MQQIQVDIFPTSFPGPLSKEAEKRDPENEVDILRAIDQKYEHRALTVDPIISTI